MAQHPYQFDRKWLLLVEGESDKSVFDRIVGRNPDLAGLFQVRFPDRGNDGTGGRSKFGAYLKGARNSQSFIDNVEAILIVSDNDSVPATSFGEVRTQLQIADFIAPNNPGDVARTAGVPAIVVLMIPVGAPGCLETLCLDALYSNWNYENNVEQFVCATPAANLEISPKSKARLQSLFAAVCSTRPDTNLSYHWREPAQYHVPLDNPAFQSIADFLDGFEAHLAANP